MIKVFIIVTLLYGDPKRTLDESVFENVVACKAYLQQTYDKATIEVFMLDCAEK